MRCIWLEFGAWTKTLLKAIIAVIRRPGARVIFGKTLASILHSSSNSEHCQLSRESFLQSPLSQAWQNGTSFDEVPTDLVSKFPVMAHAIFPRALRTSHFSCSVSFAKEWLRILQHFSYGKPCDLTYMIACFKSWRFSQCPELSKVEITKNCWWVSWVSSSTWRCGTQRRSEAWTPLSPAFLCHASLNSWIVSILGVLFLLL